MVLLKMKIGCGLLIEISADSSQNRLPLVSSISQQTTRYTIVSTIGGTSATKHSFPPSSSPHHVYLDFGKATTRAAHQFPYICSSRTRPVQYISFTCLLSISYIYNVYITFVLTTVSLGESNKLRD